MRLLCLNCGTETDTVGKNLICCPECGSQAIPADLNDSINIDITKHELRILTMWADHWAAYIEERHPGSKRAVQTILERLGMQTDAALTVGQEIADIRAAFPDSTVRVFGERDQEIDS